MSAAPPSVLGWMPSSMVQVVALLCRMTLVVASRSTHAKAVCASAGMQVLSPMTRVVIPAARSTDRAPASSVSRSAARYPVTTSRTSRADSWAMLRTCSILLDGVGVAAAGEPRGEVAGDRDQGEVPAEDVVEVPGEPQAFLRDREPGLHGPGCVDLPDQDQHPFRDAVNGDDEPDQRTRTPGPASAGTASRRRRRSRTSRW